MSLTRGNRFITWTLLLSVAACLAVGSRPAKAQSIYGTMLGKVTDPSGSAVSKAKVEASNQGTGGVLTTVTDGEGEYRILNLSPGVYTLSASVQGFAVAKITGITLPARETVRTDLALQVAATSEVVNVAADQEVVSEIPTQSSSRSGADINSLALNFRATNNTSPLQVAVLSPGVQTDQSGNVSISGGLPNATSFSIDGVSTTQVRASGPNPDLFPSVETMAEFRVNTSGSSAEYSQPTDLTIITKSGGNQFHGSGYWFFQRDALNARDTFAATKQKVQADDFGATLGGPLRKDKTFFFFAYEGTRRPQDYLINTITIPTPWRSGDLSSISTPIIDPVTKAPFQGNRIPVNPVAARVMQGLFPAANDASNTSIARPNLTTNFGGDYTLNAFDGRLDQAFGERHRVSFRASQKELRNSGTNGSGNYNTLLGTYHQNNSLTNLAGNYTWIIGPTMTNEFRGGYTYANYTNTYDFTSRANDFMKSLGLDGLPSLPALGGSPDFRITGFLGGGTSGLAPRNIDNRTIEFNNIVTWLKGRHAIKGGFEFRRLSYRDQISFGEGEEYGNYLFEGLISTPLNPGLSGPQNAFVEFLLGRPGRVRIAENGPPGNPFAYHYGGFVQDDWRLRPNLTLSIGLRYEVNPPFNDKTRQLSNFDRDFPGGRIISQDPSLTNLNYKRYIGDTPIVLPGAAGLPIGLRHTYFGNWQPRFGFAWKPFGNNKTSVRGSAGVYVVPLLGSIAYTMLGAASSSFVEYQSSDARPIVLPSINGGTSASAIPAFRRGNQFDLSEPRVVQYSISVDRDLGWSTLLRLNYTGSFTEDLIYSPDLNQLQANTTGYAALTATPALRKQNLRYPAFNEVLSRDNGPVADYNAFLVELTRRFARGLTFQNSYALSSNKTNALGSAPSSLTPNGERFPDRSGDNGANSLDRFNLAADYGDAVFTRRHRFVSTFLYELPFGRGKQYLKNISRAADAAIGGWKVTGIALLQSGPLLTPTFTGTDPSGTNPGQRSAGSYMRPDCVAGVNLLASNPTRDQWFNPAAFSRPANNIGRFGNCGVGIMEGPGTKNFSMSVGKRFSITERIGALYEVQVSNLFNITNLGIPTTAITSSSFGRATSTQSAEQAGARTMQMTVRITF